MTLSRRDTLRLAAAFAATRGTMFAVSPEEAAGALAAPARLEPKRGHVFAGVSDLNPLDPVGFAISVDSLQVDTDVMHDPQRYAAFKHAALAVEDAVRDGQGLHLVLGLLEDLDEEAIDMATVAWMGGVRAGAAYEHLRLALAVPDEQCPSCNGYGRPWADRKAGRSATCATCDGKGFVPLRRPTLELAAD